MIKFKASWNPESTLRTICAFANDFNNFGGGYIVIGIEEKDGKPVLPPIGVNLDEVDRLQKDIVRICSFLKPIYTPIVSLENYQGKNILVIWVPGGQTRPYAAPATLGKDKEYKYYIRKASTTVIAKNEELKELKLTEGRSTGMPKIHKALAYNGSPPLRIETNEDRSYFLVEIPIHPEMLPTVLLPEAIDEALEEAIDEAADEATVNVADLSNSELKLLQLCLKKPIGRQEILTEFGHKLLSGNIKQALKRLKEMKLINYTIENKPTSKKQQYKITPKGQAVLKSRRLRV